MTQNSGMSLAVVPDLVLAPMYNDADTVAAISDSFGMHMAIPRENLPEFIEGESTKSYVRRVWPLLSKEERGAALTSGIQAVQSVGTFASTAVQVRVWRAFVSGEWRLSPEKSQSFREWVYAALSTEDDGHTTEASLLATTCEVVAWLSANRPSEIPENPEECFMPGQYRRWRAVAGKLARLVKEGKEEELAPLVEAVQNEELTKTELDQIGRQKSGIPKIVMYEQAGDGSGMVGARTSLTPAQVEYLKRLPNVAWKLQGEQPSGELVEYRRSWLPAKVNDDTGEIIEGYWETWTERVWDGKQWSEWVRIEPPKIGIVEFRLTDEEFTVEYIRTWREK
jgi:hypothetical protein